MSSFDYLGGNAIAEVEVEGMEKGKGGTLLVLLKVAGGLLLTRIADRCRRESDGHRLFALRS